MKRILGIMLIIFCAVGAGVGAGMYFAVVRGIPQIAELKTYRPSNGTKVYSDNDRLIGEFNIEKGIFVPYKRFPSHLVKALVATEDKQFWEHGGIDFLAIGRAVVTDVIAGRIKEGGSTITQQLAKVLFLSPEKKITRKLQEMVLAFQIEKNLGKEEILELYLNKVYFGHGAYGIEMASRTFFGKSVDKLNVAESAMLVGLVKAPNNYSPYNNPPKAKARQKTVLKRMEEVGYLTAAEAEKAAQTPLVYRNVEKKQKRNFYFLDTVRKYLEDKYGTEVVYNGGMKVYTTMNLGMQEAAEESLRWGLQNFDKVLGWRGPIGFKNLSEEKAVVDDASLGVGLLQSGEILTGTVTRADDETADIRAGGRIGKLYKKDAAWAADKSIGKGQTARINVFRLTRILKPGDIVKVSVKSVRGGSPIFALEQTPELEGALVAIESATGHVKAMVGGYDYSTSEFNRAVTAKRQPGSSFKPIIYTAALDKGYTPASMINDESIEYHDSISGTWKPENYDRKHKGPTRLRDALAYSRNIVTIKLLESIGLGAAIETARNLGVQSDLPRDLTLGLGSLSISPLELTSAYSVFSNGGVRNEPVMIRYILDGKSNIIEQSRPDPKQVLSPETAFLITSMLRSVVDYGTGGRAKELGRPVAGKTGTTNEYRDTWFMGFTPDMTTGVWVGYDNMTTMGRRATGGSVSAPIWARFMKTALAGVETHDFQMPSGITSATIDADTGLLANSDTEKKLTEYFREGAAPTEHSTPDARARVLAQRKAATGGEADDTEDSPGMD